MKYINQVLAQRINGAQQPARRGTLWGGRFKSKVVESDAYWTHLTAYIHLNPVRAGIVERAAQARWTSHRIYQARAPRPSWLTTVKLLALFGSLDRLEAYVASVERGLPPPCFDPGRLWPRRTDPPVRRRTNSS